MVRETGRFKATVKKLTFEKIEIENINKEALSMIMVSIKWIMKSMQELEYQLLYVERKKRK